MLETTNKYAETTYIESNKCALSDALKAMRVTGSILLNEEYVPPWGITIPNSDHLQGLLRLSRDVRAVAFHWVKRGYIEITQQDGSTLIVEAGEMVICFGGRAHRLSQESSEKAIPVEDLLIAGNNPFRPAPDGAKRSTSLLCGVFIMHNFELNPVFSALPPLLHVSALRPGNLHYLPVVLDWLGREIAQPTACTYVIDRLLELLCADALRAYLETAPAGSKWFFGLKDPVVGRAIALIHAHPGADWTVARLAQSVAMSPSRFAARFSVALEDSPMGYVTKWRMNIAGRLLHESQKSVEEIAAEVGYENVAAFSRAFKRYLGLTPTAWRFRAI